MDLAMMAVAESLAQDFKHLPNSTIVRVLTECADQYPHDDAKFVEQAARSRLNALGTGEAHEP